MNREDLENDISEALEDWDEHSRFTLAGVGNLSIADINTLITCCEYHDEHGSLKHLRCFSKAVTDVLSHYGML